MERISLSNTEFEGRNNAYLFVGERTVLVDTGLAVDPVADQLEAGLADHGIAPADLDAIMLTHWHADHAALAGTFQQASDATVRAGQQEAGLVAQDDDAYAALDSARNRLLDDWGVPAGPREELLAFMEASQEQVGQPATVTPIEDGERVRAGDETLTACHTPGHTAGHTCYVRENGSVLSGDALLPQYTPNVGGADPRVDRPLGTYLDTLTRFRERDFDRAYPGHRDPIDDPAGRADEILTHHRTRANRIIRVLDNFGPADAWTVSAELFGSLDGIHIIHGPGEAFAHLDHLARHGLVERTPEGYVATDATAADLDAVFPG